MLWEEFHNINDDGIYQRENKSEEGRYGGMPYASMPATAKINVAEHEEKCKMHVLVTLMRFMKADFNFPLFVRDEIACCPEL